MLDHVLDGLLVSEILKVVFLEVDLFFELLMLFFFGSLVHCLLSIDLFLFGALGPLIDFKVVLLLGQLVFQTIEPLGVDVLKLLPPLLILDLTTHIHEVKPIPVLVVLHSQAFTLLSQPVLFLRL